MNRSWLSTQHLGRQLILVCRVVGLPYGTPLSYTWTCPNGPCKVEDRMIYHEPILVVNTTYTAYNEVYTCQVTAREGIEVYSHVSVRLRHLHSVSVPQISG